MEVTIRVLDFSWPIAVGLRGRRWFPFQELDFVVSSWWSFRERKNLVIGA